MNAEYVNFLGGSAHGGCVQAALWIQNNYYHKLRSWAIEHKAKALYLVGHSLGGAIASCLLMLLRNDLICDIGVDFEVKSYNFATPPCVSHDLIDEFKPHIETYVNEYDLVPKCSYGSIMDFKEIVTHAAKISKENKMSKKEQMDSIHELSIHLRTTNKHPRLLVPGQVYFMYKTSRLNPISKEPLITGIDIIDHSEPHYVVEKTCPEYLDHIHIKSDMAKHHFLNKYDNSLRKAIDWMQKYQKQ